MRSFAPLVFVIGPLTACQSDYNLYDGIDINPGQVTDCRLPPFLERKSASTTAIQCISERRDQRGLHWIPRH